MSATARRGHAPRHAPRVPFAVLVVGLIVGGMALLLALNTASAANELRRHDLAAKDSRVAATLQVLRNQVAAAAAPNKLAEAAAQLGMVPANKPAFLVVGSDGTVHVMGHPGAANAAPLVATHHKKKKKKPKPTKAPTPITTRKAATSAKSTGTSTSSTARTTSTSPKPGTSAKSSPRPKPTPTPTSTVTLPGGDR